MKILLLTIIVLLFSCAKHQSVLICGDHKCINKAEAKQYFEENLTLEVQIINKNLKTNYSLVDLNIEGDEPKIKVFKNKNKKIVKKLSKEEVREKKAELKKRREKSKQKTEITKKEVVLKTKKKVNTLSSYNSNDNSLDICIKLEKCDIDSIANYLIKASNEKDYPNISLRE
tara:strand:+ start:276 stop:791 length:516 start_codon:yes stop_codon:yes gene_type:complete